MQHWQDGFPSPLIFLTDVIYCHGLCSVVDGTIILFLFLFAKQYLRARFCKPNMGAQKLKGKKRIQDREGWLILHAGGTLIIASESCKLAAISSTYRTCAIHHAL